MQYYNCFTLKLIDQNGNTIITQGYRSMFIGSYDTAVAFSFTPGIVPIYNDLNEENKKLIDVKYCNTIEELVDFVTNSGGQGDAQVSINPLFYAECEISEEEYYQIPTKTFNVAIASTAYTGSEVLGDAPYIIKTYEYIPGMRFDKWFDSKYNIDNIKPFTVDGQIEHGKVSAPFLTDNDGYGCTIYGYSGVGIEFYYAIDGYFYDRDVNTPNGKQTCQLIISAI